jgi:dephospho-CoA kinase
MRGLIVAITGGIASGKSEVARRFAALGVPVADADRVARELVAPGMPALDEIAQRFGPGILHPDGSLDRAGMRQRVFADAAARSTLEGILHPRIRTELHRLCGATVAPYAMAAIPLLAEIGGRTAYPWLDRILVIDVPRELQRERLLHRDGISADLAERMLLAQADRAQRLAIADDVIDNSGALSALDAQVAGLHREYLRLAAARASER